MTKVKYLDSIPENKYKDITLNGVKTIHEGRSYAVVSCSKLTNAKLKNFKKAISDFWNGIRSSKMSLIATGFKHLKKSIVSSYTVKHFIPEDKFSSEQLTELKTKRDLLIDDVKHGGLNYPRNNLKNVLQDVVSLDKELVLNGSGCLNLRLLGPELQNDEEIILSNLSYIDNIAFIPKEFQNNREFMLKAIKKIISMCKNYEGKVDDYRLGSYLEKIDFSPFKDDVQFFLDFIEESKCLEFLKYPSNELLTNESFIHGLINIINSLTTKADALREKYSKLNELERLASTSPYMSEKDFGKPFTISYYGEIPVIFNNVEFMKALILNNPSQFGRASSEIRGNKELATLALDRDPKLLKNLAEPLSEDFEFVRPFIEKDGLLIGSLPWERDAKNSLRENKSLALIAVRQNPDAYDSLNNHFRRDPAFFIHLYKETKHNKLILKASENRIKLLKQEAEESKLELNEEAQRFIALKELSYAYDKETGRRRFEDL